MERKRGRKTVKKGEAEREMVVEWGEGERRGRWGAEIVLKDTWTPHFLVPPAACAGLCVCVCVCVSVCVRMCLFPPSLVLISHLSGAVAERSKSAAALGGEREREPATPGLVCAGE